MPRVSPDIIRIPSATVRHPVFVCLLALISTGVYLLASQLNYRAGFPLDDAWIHQTYARNLALRGEWSFIPGQPSAGSTSPLWSALLAAGHILDLGPYLWTYLLGGLLLLSLALLGGRAFQTLAGPSPAAALLAGLLLAFEWHLVWASVSGMETLLFAFLALLALVWLVAGWRRWLALGALIGLSVWVRPDGITLLAPAVMVLLLRETVWQGRFRDLALLMLGFAALFGPYLVFNRLLAGAWWPNTFYAKQAEYAVYRQAPLLYRFLEQVYPLLQGVGAVLLPGFFILLRRSLHRRDWGALAGAAWLAGYLGLYAWRLPVTYQHGRYLIPAMPVYFLWGAAGLAVWIRPGAVQFWRRILGRAWLISSGLVLFLYWIMGAGAYADDVAFIESEMVETARWVAENTRPDALIAAHDIGALGFFAERRLLDLAGLVSPQVIPFIRDEAQLEAFLNAEKADYLVAFPGWYPQLAARGRPVYQTEGRFSIAAGGENMRVYRWEFPVNGNNLPPPTLIQLEE